MSNSLGKALTTVFVLGIVVSFSSLLFLVVFYNFSVLPTIPVIVSVLVCAGFQLAAYLGGVVFQKRIWPAILCMLVCSVGTAWAGAVGPGALFGMPGTILANADKTFSNPLYLASMPVTIVGFGAGIAYFVLGVSNLLYDSYLIRREREHAGAAAAHKAPDKAAIYSQVTDMLGVTGELDAPDAAPVPVDESVSEMAEDTPEEVLEDDPAAEEDEVEVQEEATPAEEPDEKGDALPETDDSEASIDEDDQPSEIEEKAPASDVDTDEASVDITEEPAAAEEPEEEEPVPAPTGSVFSRVTAKIATFFAVEQPEDAAEEPAAEKPIEAETEPSTEEPSEEESPAAVAEPEEDDTPEDEPPEAGAEPSTEDAEIAIGETDEEDVTGEESIGSDPDEDTSDDEDEDEPVPVRDDETPNADDEVDAEDAGEEDATPEADEPEPGEDCKDATDADTPAEDRDDVNDPDKPAEILEEKPDDTVDNEELPSFLTMRRSELLSDWAETSCAPIPLEDLSVSLETDRLRILRLDKKAFSALLQGIEEMETATGLTPSGEQLDSHTLDTFDSLYSRALENPQNYKWFAVWIITSKAENKLLGSAGFKGRPDGDGEVELGYGVNETRRGNNYADEAAVALCQWALLQQDVRAVTAETALVNVESENLVEKAGLKRVKETSTSCFWRLEKQEGA